MKSVYWVILISIFSILALPQYATEVRKEEPFPFWYPEYAAQGNSSVAYSDGFGALFSNPAGFSLPKREINLLNSVFSIYGSPKARVPLVRSLLRNSMSTSDETFLSEDLTGSGLGISSIFGLGYVGRGLGLGLLGGVEVVSSGDEYPSELRGDVLSQFMLVVGYAIQKELWGVQFLLGADIRPLIRIHAPLEERETALLLNHYLGTSIDPIIGNFYTDTYALNGSGIGIDLGLMVLWNSFSFGFVLQDLFDTQLFYSWNDLSSVRDALSRGGLPPVNSPPDNAIYTIPMSLTVGAAYTTNFDAWKRVFQARVHAEWLNPHRSSLSSFRAGAEATFFSTLSLRAGLHEGEPTYGLGLSIGILTLNSAIFTRRIEQI
ncbi:MAG: hypothetical protein SNJ78_10885, partial [Spirochaetales bacterium]